VIVLDEHIVGFGDGLIRYRSCDDFAHGDEVRRVSPPALNL